MASASQMVATVELLIKGGTGSGAVAPPGAGKGGKPKLSPAQLKKSKQKSIAGMDRAKGGILGSGVGPKIGGQQKGSLVAKGGDSSKMVGMAKQSLKQGSAMVKSGGKAAGISASLGSILKQSQLFTGVIGTIFQILGMLVDVIIMPFMPILVPVIKLFAKSVPILMWIMNNTVGIAVKLIVGYLKFVVNFWKGVLTLLWTKIMKPIWDLIWSKALGPIWTKITEITGFLGNLIAPIWEAIMSVWNKIKDPSQWFSGPLHPVGVALDVLKGAFNIITDIVKGAWSVAKGIIEGIWNIIKTIFSVYKAIFKLYFDIIKAIINTIITIIKGAWDIAKGIFNGVWDFIKTAFSGIKDFFSGLWDGLKGFFSGIWDFAKGLFNGAVDFIKGIPGAIWGFLQDIWGIIKAVVSMYLTAIITVKDFAVGILQKVKDFFLGVWNTVKEWFNTAKQWIFDKIKEWATNFVNNILLIKDFAIGIFQKVKDFFLGVWDTAKEWFSTARQWIIDKIKDWAATFVSAIITVKDWAVGIFQKIKDFFTTLKDTVVNWFITAKQWIIDAFKTWLANFVAGVLLIKDRVIEMVQKVKEVFIGIWDGAKDWVVNKISAIKDFFTGLWEKAQTIIGLIKEKVISIFEKINTIREKVISVLEMINPLNWIPKIVEKIKGLIPSPGELVDNIPGVGTVKNVASKLKFWQSGAIVSKPTLGVAGEAGPEIIAPLKVLGGLRFLQPIFKGVRGIMDMVPKMGGLVHKFAEMVKESFGRLFRDMFPKIGQTLVKIGQLEKIGLDMIKDLGQAVIKGMKFNIDNITQLASQTWKFMHMSTELIGKSLFNIQKTSAANVGRLDMIGNMLGDVSYLRRDVRGIYDYLPSLDKSLRKAAKASNRRPPVNITVINKTNEGRESQENFVAEKHETAEDNHEFEFDNSADWRYIS